MIRRFFSGWCVVRWCSLGLILGFSFSACKRQAGTGTDRMLPNPSAPALYGPSTGTVSSQIARRRDPASAGTSWQSAPFYLLQTELSPATLVHSSTKYLGLFTGLTNYGLSAPSHLAWPTMNGPRTFKRGESLNLTNMAQNWILVWWAGAGGWTNWDSPWVVFLQHRPDSMALNDDGLHLGFPEAAGDVVLMPLYGYEKPPQQGHDFRAQHGLPPNKVPIKTWEWPKVVTRDPLTRIRYWASAVREFPIYCEDTFSVDRAKDSVTIRSRFHWRSIRDDWNTPHLKLAPLSPSLGLAVQQGGFPVEFSKNWFDLNLSTPFGPYLAIEGADEFETTFSVLQYVNETEAFVPPATNAHPAVRLAFDCLQRLALELHSRPAAAVAGDRMGQGRAFVNAGWEARALRYLDDGARSNAVVKLRASLHDALLAGVDRNEAASSHSAIEALWAYAHFSGDWPFVRERWPMIQKRFGIPAMTRWGGFGGDGILEADAQVGSCIAFARLAWQAGDLEAYQYACSVVARQLVQAFLKQRGADYFRNHQPYHSMEAIDEEVFVTGLRRDGGGWQIDGPRYPAEATGRRFSQRWLGFHDFDVARFFRDYLKEDARRELNWLQHRSQQGSNWWNTSTGLPEFLPLRSLLLNASPAELVSMASPDAFGESGSNPIANCLSVLRVGQSTRFERMIPPGPPSAFQIGVERDVAGPGTPLLTFVAAEKAGANPVSSISVPDWPQLQWREWTTPTGAAWTFGHIRPVREGAPARVESVPLNWNTRVLRFEMHE